MVEERRLRVLIYGINFAPDLTGIGKYTGAMAAWLAAQRHDVRVVTAPPYYPDWKITDGYRGNGYRRETWCGVEVNRAPLWVPRRPSGVKRVLHHLSFAVASLPLLLRQILWRPDVVWMAAPSLACAPGALLVAKLTGAVSCLHLQDFEVDAAFELGLLKGRRVRTAALAVERVLLRGFDRVSSISASMGACLRRKGVETERLATLPNWADVEILKASSAPNRFRAELGIPQETVVALYAGSLGQKQGFETLIDAARSLQNEPGICFVFCGQGAGRATLMQATAGLPNVRWMRLQPVERLPDLMHFADIHLLPQRRGVADLVLPSKLTNMLASGRPVVCTAERGTDLARWIEGCGLVVPPEDAPALAAGLKLLADSEERRREMGQVARRRAESLLSKVTILGAYFDSLQMQVVERARVPAREQA